MPHLNELNEKYADRGLSVLALTSEGPGQTEPWIEKNGAEYAYAYDKGGKLSRELGVSGIPNAVIVNPAGKVVWQGSPSRISDDVVEGFLGGALATPVYEMPKEASAVAKSLRARQFAKAIAAAADLQDPTIKESLEAMVVAQVDALKAARDEGDFLSASETAKRLAKELAGLDAGAEAKTIASELGRDGEAKRVIKGQKAVAKLRGEPVKRPKDAAELIKKLRKLEDKFAGTAAGRDAEQFRS